MPNASNPSTLQRWQSSIVRYTDQLEREWIGVVGDPPAQTIDLANLKPDRPGIDYCDRCGTTFSAPSETVARPCTVCTNRRFPWQTLIRLGPYDGDLRGWIPQTKFHSWDTMGLELGRRLGQQVSLSPVEFDGIVPIPTPTFHRLRRGIDHTAIIARGMASVLKRPIIHALRKSSRPPQQTVATSFRRANVRGSIAKRRRHSMKGYRVLLIDDVATTGATLKEACAVLKRTNPPISIDIAVVGVAGAL